MLLNELFYFFVLIESNHIFFSVYVCSRLRQMLLMLFCKAGIPVACFLHSSSSCKINLNENGYVRKNAHKILFLQTKILYLY